nr:hypothetical protein [Tanacetum cinerariifolium]
MLRAQGEILQVDRQGLFNATTVKEKAMLPEAQEAGQILDGEQLVFLENPRIPAGQAQTIIPHNAAFQTEDLDNYDSDCDDLSNAQAVLMANISNYGSDVISELKFKTSGSKPSGNTKNNRISQPSSSNKINKVEDQPRSVKTRKNNKNRVKKVKCDDHVMQSSSNTNSVYVSINNAPVKNYVNDVKSGCLCAIYGKYMSSETHHECVRLVVTKTNKCKKSKSAKKLKKQNIWKPTGHVFTEVGLKWKPTGRTFTIVGNSCHLTRFTSTNIVPPKQPTSHLDEIQKPEIKVYCMKPKNVKHIGSSKIAKIVESKNANHSKPNHTWGSIATDIPSSSSLVMTGCLDCTLIAIIMGYGDYQLGNVAISRKNTYFIRDLEGVYLISRSHDTNLYTISLDELLKSSPICLLSKALKTKSWLWHRRLYHLNFGTLNKLAKDGLARGIPRLKFQKDHLCSTYILGKSKISSHQPKAKDTNQEKLYLLHMDLCGPMRVASINRKRYILVIVDDYSRFTWNVRTDNGTEFVNQTLGEFYENVGISHQTSIARTPQHNGVVERDDWDRLFQPMFDEYFNPPTTIVSPVQEVAALRAEVLADSPVSISISQDVPSTKPKNFKQAMNEPSWIDAMQEEIHEFERLEVWELVPCLDNVFLIKLKWIYKIKKDESGGVLKNKA